MFNRHAVWLRHRKQEKNVFPERNLVFPWTFKSDYVDGNIKKIHASGTLTCVTAYVNMKLHLRKHFFPSTETWQRHVKKWYGSAVTVATETRLTSPYRQRKRVLTVVFPQRFHIFLPRFRSRIQLDISSCVNSTRRKIAVRNWVKNVAPFS